METYFVILFFLVVIPFILVIIFFFRFLIVEEESKWVVFKVIEFWNILVIPIFFLTTNDWKKINDCCGDTAVFSPQHRLTIYVLIFLCTTAYVISCFRKNILPPLLEVLLNLFLVAGLILNIVLYFHFDSEEFGKLIWLMGNIPIILLIIMRLIVHHQMISKEIEENVISANNFSEQVSLWILKLNPFLKYPLLTVLVIPIIILLSLCLLVFGQKPDSAIRAFTDTYKHGFSQLDYQCDNVECGGHFLCSVGANGHKNIVKPQRYGERNGSKIICTRQLLIANAFEELIEEKFPVIHSFIRKKYNKVGNIIHRYYFIFTIKLVSDVIYILMKPLEWIFLFILYSFDARPENRIAKQYLSKNDRYKIQQIMNCTN